MNNNDITTSFLNMAFQKVICRHKQTSMPEQIKIGDKYYLDRLSVSIDTEGNAYGAIYTDKKKRIARMPLSYFTTVYNEDNQKEEYNNIKHGRLVHYRS